MSYLYNVYDDEDNLIIENKPSREVGFVLGIDSVRVSRCARDGTLVQGKYKIEQIAEREKLEGSWFSGKLQREWDEVTQPFKRVKWVKERVRGVRKLHGRKIERDL